MSTQTNETIFQIGTASARDFSEDCVPGDWEDFGTIKFPTPFPTPFPAGKGVRVIVTANDLEVPRGVHNAAVVGIVRHTDELGQPIPPEQGFRLWGRNSDCARGLAGFNWMAVLETPGKTQKRPIDLRMAVLQPQHFQPDCKPGDWKSWGVNFSTDFSDEPITLLTASNLNVIPWHRDDTLWYHNAAVVGIVQDSAATGFTLSARNSDCAEGDCAFYYVALSQQMAGKEDLWVDSGEVTAQTFAPDCKSGDWGDWTITFSQPFLSAPVVLVTANDLRAKGGNPAVVGIARNVTPYGFLLSARNSDCAPGQAGFYWVAIGCARGCGYEGAEGARPPRPPK